jgi:hypothetical protein
VKKKKKNTREQDRGDHFLKIIKMWKILQADQGKTIFNKARLAKVYFGLKESEIKERHKRYVQRVMAPLVKAGIARDTNKDGDKPELRKNACEERCWQYTSLGVEGIKVK